jgi:hypothetical protein
MSFDIKPQPSFIELIIASQTDWFELMVLKCILSDSEFRSRAIKVLNIDALTGKPVKDFTADIDNAVYQAIMTFVQCTGGRVEMPMNFAHSILTQMGDQADLIGAGEVPMAIHRLETARNLDLQAAAPLVAAGFKIWLTKRRTERIIRAHTSANTWNSEAMMNEARVNSVAVDMSTAADTFFEFGHGIDTVKLDVKRIKIPTLGQLTRALGGGFAKKEGTLFIAPEGSGKTILGCKLGSVLTSQENQVGVVISTEQDHEELEPRVIASNCGVPYDLIKDGVKLELLTKEQKDSYHRFRDAIKGKLFWEDWGAADHGRSIEHDLLEIIDRRQNQIGRKIDFIVLDWIGGALGKLEGKDGDKLTFIMKLAGDTVCQIAKDMDMYTIAFAQASMALAVNKKRVDASCIANCKSLGQKFTNVIGITMMYAENQNLEAGDEPIYDNRQWFYISKGRKSKGGCVPFMRRFNFQDMADIHGGHA